MAARVRAEHGRQALDPLQAAFGANIFDTPSPAGAGDQREHLERRGTREFVGPILREAGLPTELADALDEESWDSEIRRGR